MKSGRTRLFRGDVGLVCGLREGNPLDDRRHRKLISGRDCNSKLGQIRVTGACPVDPSLHKGSPKAR
jgi:hypothetical protein